VALVVRLAALVWAGAGTFSTHPQSSAPQPLDEVPVPFGMAVGHMLEFRITHRPVTAPQ
jgi:hypothetical protein